MLVLKIGPENGGNQGAETDYLPGNRAAVKVLIRVIVIQIQTYQTGRSGTLLSWYYVPRFFTQNPRFSY